MGRLGYAKLETYGLELAPDGRVRSAHRTLHDDGGGGPIVGWLADDLGVANLPAWSAANALPPPAAAVEHDEWEAAITRARAQVAVAPASGAQFATAPDFTDEAATVLDATAASPQVVANVIVSWPARPMPPRPMPPRPRAPSQPIPPLPRRAVPPPPPPRRTAQGTEPHEPPHKTSSCT